MEDMIVDEATGIRGSLSMQLSETVDKSSQLMMDRLVAFVAFGCPKTETTRPCMIPIPSPDKQWCSAKEMIVGRATLY